MNVVKNDFKVMLESKFTEGILMHTHKHGLWSIIQDARRLSQDPDVRNELNENLIEQEF
jgi:hypothetical protein